MKVHVLGLGQSLIYYEPDGNISVGVNDIYKYHKADYIVCVDLPKVFSPERLDTIIWSTPKKFLSLFPEWEQYFGASFQLIEKCSGVGKFDAFESPCYTCSNNSAFVAVVHAYKLGAKEIILHGVDFKNHKALSRERSFLKAMSHFHEMFFYLKQKGVNLYVGNSYSALSSIIPVYRNDSVQP